MPSSQLSIKPARRHKEYCDVLLLCVNEHEINEVFNVFGDSGHQARPYSKPGLKLSFHDFGLINEARVLCLRTNMGSIGQGSTAAAVKQAILEIQPKFIVAVGIAFGADESEQPVGNILLSTQVALYDPAKKTIKKGERQTLRRGAVTDVPQEILGKFVTAIQYWKGAKVHTGQMLTGEILINDPTFKKALIDDYPEAIGGEMEAAGIYSATSYEAVNWIVVKAVCDHADGHKDLDKEGRQQLAASNAASFVLHTLNTINFSCMPHQKPGETSASSVLQQSFNVTDNSIEKINIGKVSGDVNIQTNAKASFESQQQSVEDSLHTDTAISALKKIIRRRALPKCDPTQEIQTLVYRIEQGDLSFASKSAKLDVFLWAARILAPLPNQTTLVEHYMSQCRLLSPQGENERLAVVEALLDQAAGNLPNCIEKLSHIDTPDSRSNIMALLVKQKGLSSAIDWFNTFQPVEASFFSPVGWRNAAVQFAQDEQWDEAVRLLSDLPPDVIEECPDIIFVLGMLHAGYLLPLSHRQHLMSEKFIGLTEEAQEGDVAKQHRNKAITCFKRAHELMNEVDAFARAEGCEYWLMWLRLIAPETKEKASAELREAMQDGKKAGSMLEFAMRFEIDFDSAPLENYLRRIKLERKLSDLEHSAQFMLLLHQGVPADVIKFLKDENDSLLKVYLPDTLASFYINALVEDGRLADAEKELERQKDIFPAEILERLRLMIASQKGEELSQLTALHERTGDYLDLQNLVNYLRKTNQWESLLPKGKLLLEQRRSAGNACLVVNAMHMTKTKSEDVLDFIKENEDLATIETKNGARLLNYKAWELFTTGMFADARTVVDGLIAKYRVPEDISLEINIALRTGQWERFAEIVEREYPRRSTLPSQLLMQMASVVADRVDDRAMDLLEVAAEKAPEDANLQSYAYFLSSQIGREAQAGHWLKRVFELSQKGVGSGKTIGLEEMVEMMPAHIEENKVWVRKLMTGELPMHTAPALLNTSLAQILIGNALLNETQQDPRRRFLIPIRHGSRTSSEPPHFRRLIMDVTSLMIFEHLGFIETVFNSVEAVLLSPRVMDVLFEEHRKVRFHQPSRVLMAERTHMLITDGAISLLKDTAPPDLLVKEVGSEMASLLHAAQIQGGRVVASLPIHKAGSMNREPADLKEYAPLILKTTQLLSLLEDDLDPDTYDKAFTYLCSVDRGEALGSDSLGGGPLFIDDLALVYLNIVEILDDVTRLGDKTVVTPSVDARAKSLIEEGKHGEQLAGIIDQLRKKIRDAISTGKVKFLSQAHDPEVGNFDKTWQMNLLQDAFSGLVDCDAVCVDDRSMGKHLLAVDNQHIRSVPNLGIYDILNRLSVDNVISHEEKNKALLRLRKRNFAFFPVTVEEVFEAVKLQTTLNKEIFLENRDLKAIRENILSIRSNQILRFPDEAFWVDQLAQVGTTLLIKIWQDKGISSKLATQVSDWIMDVLLPMPTDWMNSTIQEKEVDIFHLTVNHVFRCVNIVAVVKTSSRKSSYTLWLENRMIRPLLMANVNVIDEVSRMTGVQIVNSVREV